MGGRGRGRGQKVSFMDNINKRLGLTTDQQGSKQFVSLPLPDYPNLTVKPDTFLEFEDNRLLVKIKNKLYNSIRESGFYVVSEKDDHDFEKYTDKYKIKHPQLKLDYSIFPPELCPNRWKLTEKEASEPSNAPSKRVRLDSVGSTLVEELNVAEEAQKVLQFASVGEGDGEEVAPEIKKDEEDDEEDDTRQVEESDEEIDEENFEDANDYAMSYFDNGEGYGDDEEGLGEEAYM